MLYLLLLRQSSWAIKQTAPRLPKNSVTAEISLFRWAVAWQLMMKGSVITLLIRKGLTSYMLLFFASLPFNHLKLSEPVCTSEICWPFCPHVPAGLLENWSPQSVSDKYPGSSTLPGHENNGWIFLMFSLLHLFFSSPFEDCIPLCAFYTEYFASCPEGRSFQMKKVVFIMPNFVPFLL